MKGRSILIGLGIAVAVVALALTILSLASPGFSSSLTSLPLVFHDGQEIQVTGHFTCVPTTGLDVCLLGFADSEGRHYLLTNLQGIERANPGASSMFRDSTAGNTFHLTGVFSYGAPDHPSHVIVAGQIEVTSLELIGNDVQFVIPDSVKPF